MHLLYIFATAAFKEAITIPCREMAYRFFYTDCYRWLCKYWSVMDVRFDWMLDSRVKDLW